MLLVQIEKKKAQTDYFHILRAHYFILPGPIFHFSCTIKKWQQRGRILFVYVVCWCVAKALTVRQRDGRDVDINPDIFSSL